MSLPPSPPDLSVVLPVYNESEAIVPVLEEIGTVLDAVLPDRYEIVAVDDGSTDDTAQRITDAAEGFPAIRLVSLAGNLGQSGALWAGFQRARAECIATMDADGQNDPADLPKMLEQLGAADAIFGFRARRKDPWSKRIGSKLANAVRNRILQEEIIDTGCAIKIFKRSLTTDLTPWKGMHRFFGSLFTMQGAEIKQIAVNHRPRSAGQSKYTNWGRLPRTIRDLFAVRWLRNRYLRIQTK